MYRINPFVPVVPQKARIFWGYLANKSILWEKIEQLMFFHTKPIRNLKKCFKVCVIPNLFS